MKKMIVGMLVALFAVTVTAVAWDRANMTISKLETENITASGAITATGAVTGGSLVGRLAATGATITGASTVGVTTVTGNLTAGGTTSTFTNNLVVNKKFYLSTNCYITVGADGTNLLVISGGAGATTNQIAGWAQ